MCIRYRKKNLGDLRLCDVCTAEVGRFQKIDCQNKKIKLYENPSCTGTAKEESFDDCVGLEIVRGIYSDEAQYGPLSSFGFLTVMCLMVMIALLIIFC